MKRLLLLALLALPLLATLGGCVVFEDRDGYDHHRYWNDHDRW